MNNKNKFIWAVIVIAFLGLISAVLLVRRSQEIRRGAYYGGIGAGIWPSERDAVVGEEFDVYLKISPAEFLVSGADLNVSFDKSVLELTNIEFDQFFFGSTSASEANSSGSLSISAVSIIEREKLYREPFDLVTLTFRPVKTGSANISINGSDYQIVGSRGQEGDIDRTLELGSLTASTIQVTDSGDWAVLDFSVFMSGTKFKVDNQQVIVDIPDQKMKVVVRKGDFRKEFDGVNVIFDDQAIGRGSVTLAGVAPGDNYAVLVKGPVHLSRRFCGDNQEEHCWVGEENISLAIGLNNYDWSGLALEAGDVNSDGIVNSVDFALLKAALGNSSVKEDINFNGVVNTQDIAIFLSTLSTKYEEDF